MVSTIVDALVFKGAFDQNSTIKFQELVENVDKDVYYDFVLERLVNDKRCRYRGHMRMKPMFCCELSNMFLVVLYNGDDLHPETLVVSPDVFGAAIAFSEKYRLYKSFGQECDVHCLSASYTGFALNVYMITQFFPMDQVMDIIKSNSLGCDENENGGCGTLP